MNSNINPNNIDNIDNNNVINNQIISQLNYDLLANNNVLIQNQNIIPQNTQEIQNDINNINNLNNLKNNNFDFNQNYNYPSTNQLIDNVQYLNNNININPGNDNMSNTPWGQMNLTYDEYEKKRLKEENRKKQEEFKKMLDEQRVQKLYNKEMNNAENKTKKQNHLVDLPIIITNEKKILDSLQTSLKKGDLNNENQNIINLEPNIKQYNEVIVYENQVEGNTQMSDQPHEIIAKKYQDMLNNYIDEKTKDIEIQRNQVINDNNLIENFDKDSNYNNNDIKIENELVEENINNIKKINNKAKLRIKLNDNKKNNNKNKNKTEINMFRKDYDKKNKTINSNNNEGNKFIFGDKKNLTGNRINGKSTNMNKYYKIEGEQHKNNIFVKKNEEKKVQQRSRSLIPKVKLPAKSSEVKIKYAVKERKPNNNIKKSIRDADLVEDDPLNKLQNIQKYIRGILDEYKQK